MSIYSITSTNSATSSTEGISERSSSTGSSWLPSATIPISSQEHTDGQHADNHFILSIRDQHQSLSVLHFKQIDSFYLQKAVPLPIINRKYKFWPI